MKTFRWYVRIVNCYCLRESVFVGMKTCGASGAGGTNGAGGANGANGASGASGASVDREFFNLLLP